MTPGRKTHPKRRACGWGKPLHLVLRSTSAIVIDACAFYLGWILLPQCPAKKRENNTYTERACCTCLTPYFMWNTTAKCATYRTLWLFMLMLTPCFEYPHKRKEERALSRGVTL